MNTSRTPMERPTAAAWRFSLASADYDRLRDGFQPRDMDDKWAVVAEHESDARPRFPGVTVSPNVLVVRIVRSWTGYESYVLAVGARGVEAIAWDMRSTPTLHICEEQAKMDVLILCRGILGCVFEGQPQFSSDMLWTGVQDRERARAVAAGQGRGHEAGRGGRGQDRDNGRAHPPSHPPSQQRGQRDRDRGERGGRGGQQRPDERADRDQAVCGRGRGNVFRHVDPREVHRLVQQARQQGNPGQNNRQ